MTPVSNFHLLDKARRRHRRNKSLPKLTPGSGRVDPNGGLKATLTAVTGETFTYRFAPCTVWVAVLTERRPAPISKPRPEVSEGDQAKHHVDALLDIACGLESRVARAAEPKAAPTNVSNE